uniref:Uncharacterized protein n=1 Tax=Anopheles merus TaxID=30066 RepID=A0A182VE47_ANOME
MSVSQKRGVIGATGFGCRSSIVSLSRRTLCTSADSRSSRPCRISITRSRFISSFSNRSTSFASGQPPGISPPTCSSADELSADRVESIEKRLSSPTGTDPIVHGFAQYSSSLSGQSGIDCHWFAPSWRCSAITSASSLCCSSASFFSRLRRNASSSRSQSAFGFIASFSRILRFSSTIKLFCRSSFCFSLANRFDCWMAATEADGWLAVGVDRGPPASSSSSPLGTAGSWAMIAASMSVACCCANEAVEDSFLHSFRLLPLAVLLCERLHRHLLVVHLDKGLPFRQRAHHVGRFCSEMLLRLLLLLLMMIVVVQGMVTWRCLAHASPAG